MIEESLRRHAGSRSSKQQPLAEEPEVDSRTGDRRRKSSHRQMALKPHHSAAPPPSRQVRVLRPTAAALNAGIRPGERAPAPTPPPALLHRKNDVDRTDRSADVRERPSLPRSERLGTPGETATPQTTYIPPPDAGRRRSRRSSPRGGRKIEGKGGRFDRGDFIPPPRALSLEDRIAGRMEMPGSGELKVSSSDRRIDG